MAQMLRSRTVLLFSFSVMSLLLMAYIHRFGVNVPWGDEWDVLPLVAKLQQGSLTFSDFFKLHNEHWIVFPKMVMVTNALIFSGNVKLLMYLTGVMFMGICWLCMVHWQRLKIPFHGMFAILIPVVLFNYRQYENLLWGFQIGFISAILFSFLALHALQATDQSQERAPLIFVAAVAAGLIASFSSSHGLLVWPCGVLSMLLVERSRRRYLAVWLSVGTLIWICYLVALRATSLKQGITSISGNPLAAGRFFTSLVGYALLPERSLSWIAGAVTLIALGLAVAKLKAGGAISLIRFWLSLNLFSLLALCAITLGRSGMGAFYAFEPRYLTFSLILVISTVVMVCAAVAGYETPAARAFRTILLVAMLASMLWSYSIGWNDGIGFRGRQEGSLFLLRNYRMVSDEGLRDLYLPNGAVVRERAPILERLHHAAF